MPTSSTIVQQQCDQVACKIAEGGSCLEGLSLDPRATDRCPHLLLALNDDTEAQETDDEMEEEDDEDDALPLQPDPAPLLYVRSGEELNTSEAVEVMRSAPSRLIVVMGDSDSGKTTLYATLYEQFCRGPYAGWTFAGSRTLGAFERICHDSRKSSGRIEPTTLHTRPSDEPFFLHLRLSRSEATDPHLFHPALPQELLFANVSGEDFVEMRDSQEFALHAAYLRRADHVALVLDGKKLASLAARHQPLHSAQQLLMRLGGTNYIGPHTMVDVVIAKWDELQTPRGEGRATAEGCRAFALQMETNFQDQFQGLFGGLRFHWISARPYKSSEVAEGYGLDVLLESWANQSKLLRTQGALTSRVVAGEPREAARFISKGMGEPTQS